MVKFDKIVDEPKLIIFKLINNSNERILKFHLKKDDTFSISLTNPAGMRFSLSDLMLDGLHGTPNLGVEDLNLYSYDREWNKVIAIVKTGNYRVESIVSVKVRK